MRQQTIVKDEQGHSLVLLDMANVYSLVQAQEARRELTPPDLGLHKICTRVPALTLSRLSAPPLALELLPLQERPLRARLPKLSPLGRQPLPTNLRPPRRRTYQ